MFCFDLGGSGGLGISLLHWLEVNDVPPVVNVITAARLSETKREGVSRVR